MIEDSLASVVPVRSTDRNTADFGKSHDDDNEEDEIEREYNLRAS